MHEPLNPSDPSRAPDPAHDDPAVGPDPVGSVPTTHDGPPEHPDIRFETTDVSLRAILIVLAAAAGFAVVFHVVIWFFFAGYRDHEANVKRSSFPLATLEERNDRPRGPRLEQIDRLDGARTTSAYKLEVDKLRALDDYGPTKEEGFVRVPIGQAMKYLAGKLPARAEPSEGQKRRSGGLVDAGEPNAGRMFRRGAK